MIDWKFFDYFSFIRTHDCSTVSDICYEALVSIKKCYDCTWTWSVKFPRIRLLVKYFFTFFKTMNQGFFHIRRKTNLFFKLPLLFGYKQMQIITQKVSTICSSVSIKYSKICNFFPFSTVFWSRQIKYDSNSVLIIISYWALICWSRISLNISIWFQTVFCRLKIWYRQHYFRKRRISIFTDLDVPWRKIFYFWVQINFFPDNLIRLSNGWLRFWPWLILIGIFIILHHL